MDRRQFVRVTSSVGAGLALAVMLDGCGAEAPPTAAPDQFAPDAWIRIAPDGTVTVMVDRAEMGQGVSTSLPMLVAEELDAEWSSVRYEFAPANEAYFNPVMKIQATGGSTSIRAAWEPLRRAGALARSMLIAAAAKSWNVPPSECSTEPGVVVHRGSGRRVGYGAIAGAAAREPVPAEVSLKDPKDFRLIGTSVRRLDLAEKVTGRAQFGLDAGPRDASVAVVARCPVFGGELDSFDPAPAMAIAGVKQVVAIDSGVAVVADSFWAAERGRAALTIAWREGSAAELDDSAVAAELTRLAGPEGRLARAVGDVATAAAARTVEAAYDVPYLAHATMEPMNCTADVRPDRVTVWVPTQFQAAPSYLAGGGTRGVAASIAGVAAEQVTVITTHLGGGFGRRSEVDMVREAVQVSKAVGGPVRLVWTREDDIQHDFYRPAARHVMGAGLDASGMITWWRHHTASQSIFSKFLPGFVPQWATRIAGPLKGGIDPSAVEGAVDHPYEVPNIEVRYGMADLPVPVGYWRAVGHTHTAFAVESFIDELATAAGRDPVEYRLGLLSNAARHRAVLTLAAERAGWGTPSPRGWSRGVAVHESFGSFVAQVAEVEIEGSTIRVRRVICAVDCGAVVNPDTVQAQMEGAIAYGLSATLTGRISIAKGRVRQSNFHDYPVLRMNEMPVVEVHLVASPYLPGGVGEPGTPPIAPAVANAVFAATGRRLRTLPLALADGS
ncbi:MAG: molybdopterin cofactor-binding domain-containing protein [Gemmatimonadales bacterium]